MSTLSTKYNPIAKLEETRNLQEQQTRQADLGIESTFDRDRIKESNFTIGNNSARAENTLYQDTFPFHKGDANVRRQQQQFQKARSSNLRQHSYKLGSDDNSSGNTKSFQQSDFTSYNPSLYQKNKKDIRSIGSVQFPNNWYRNPNDAQEWGKKHLKSETHSQFVKKPVTDPMEIKETRDATKLANITQKFQYGYHDEPALRQTSTYTDTCNSSDQSIDLHARKRRADQIQAQKKVLSNSSIIHGDPKTDSLHQNISAYDEDMGRANKHGSVIPHEQRREQRDANVEMKGRIQKTSVVLGSDRASYRSEYKGTFRDVEFKK